ILNDNAKHLLNRLEKYAIIKELLTLVEKLLNKLENKNAYIETGLICLIGSTMKLEANIEKSDYADLEKESILQLENVLKSVNMSLYDYKLLILMKIRSNDEFLRNKSQTLMQAKEKLQTSIPEEMKFFKELLQKVFNTL
ncbi:13911_t:CDS:2, partial [Funneliformis mosseae]